MWRLKSADDSGGHPYLRSLNNHQGRQTWEFEEEAGTPAQRQQVDELRAAFTANRLQQKHSSDELLRLQSSQTASTSKASSPLPAVSLQDGKPVSEDQVLQALQGAVDFFQTLQADDGHWPGDYGGPMFLMPGLLITTYITGVIDTALTPAHKTEMIRYLTNHQNEDGGYGLHIEGPSTMFGTVLNYVSLRLLGLGPDQVCCMTARNWILDQGGATYISSWGKFWLAVLGVYSWDGMNPTQPEMWLLPYSSWTGIGWLHPGRFWCHCRMVYLPMSYVYGMRGTAKETPLIAAIRRELYTQSYGSIDWNAARNLCCKTDLYYPHPMIQDVLWWTLSQAERLLKGSWLRKKALEEAMRLIHYEDENTRYVCIGPVNKVINMLACYFEDPDSEAVKRHVPRLQDYLWVAEDGMKMQGYNGSQLWDTAFAVQALLATGLQERCGNALHKAHHYLDVTQVLEDAPGPLHKWYRHISKGAWPFSTRDHGWPISDCSSEGLKAALALSMAGSQVAGPALPAERLFNAVNVILSYQNHDGGWATYENTRSFHVLEVINPSETFGDIIVDYSYVECSSACITALAAFRNCHPAHRINEIKTAICRGVSYIHSIQRPDGSWYGSWGVCFTYGTWFGCEALAAIGETIKTSPALQTACNFLISKQRSDGGWAESYLSCQDKVYTQLPEGSSHVVNTGWAMLALLAAGYHEQDCRPLAAAARFLISKQLPSGDWPQQHISGVFNRNCMITYANYRTIFPMWAIGEYRQKVLHSAPNHA